MKDIYENKSKEILEEEKEQRKDHYIENGEKILENRKEDYDESKEKILDRKKKHYEEHKEKILENRKEHYNEKRVSIRANQAEYYKKTRSQIYQRQRFRKHFDKKNAMSYLTVHQEHLYHHTNGFCQPETMEYLNHSIEYYDGVCQFCNEKHSIKIIGVNREVCSSCNKAQCSVCNSEVSPDPEHGCLHYSPDAGGLLGFLPGYCPLYSEIYFPDFSAITWIANRKDCSICDSISVNYPEYEIFR